LSNDQAALAASCNCDWIAPFELIGTLPRVFHRASPKQTLSASNDENTFWFVPRGIAGFWIYYQRHSETEHRKHLFQACPSLYGAELGSAFAELGTAVRDNKAQGASEFDLGPFVDRMIAYRAGVRLISADEDFELSELERQGLQYLAIHFEMMGDVRFSFADPLKLDDGDREAILGAIIPAPLERFLPSLQLHMHEGELCDLSAPFVDIEFDADTTSAFGKMRAIARLFEQGFPEELALSLDEFLAGLG
jgi:hypothetical protein